MILDQMEIFDISPVISPRLAVFPGDTPFQRDILLDLKKGDHLSLSWMKMTAHLGSHADAPNHYARDGAGIDKRPLTTYLGTAQVLELAQRPGERLRPSDLRGITIDVPRILFKTKSFPNPEQWTSDFMSLSSDLIDHLAERGVKLVGIDTPSIDPADDKILESHHAVARHDMAILEGLVLDHVKPGRYQLVALPLAIEGADASPVRAVLMREGPKWKKS